MPVIITTNLGNFFPDLDGVFAASAFFSYESSARRRMLKSSSGVHDVLETINAGRSERISGGDTLSYVPDESDCAEDVGGLGWGADGVVVNGVEYGRRKGGTKPARGACAKWGASSRNS